MEKFLKFLKDNYVFLLIGIVAVYFFFDKIKDFFRRVFSPTAQESANDNSGADYLGSQVERQYKGIKVGADGEEYFYYGDKKVRLTTANKAKVVDFVNQCYNYMENNTCSLYDYLFNSERPSFNTPEIQATLNRFLDWCGNRETWIHFFAYIFFQLHNVQFLDYLRCVLDAEGYESTSRNVRGLTLFYY